MFQEKLPNDHFLSAYGLSEMAPVSMTGYEDTQEHVLYTVGRPVKNISIKIQDKDTKEDQGVGKTGEILVQGFNLMSGYYKVPSRYIIYDRFPTLGTGKIDTVTLRKDAIARISEG